MGGMRGFPGGGMRFQGHPGFRAQPGFHGEIDPADLFNMFFGGGGMDAGFGGGPFGNARGGYMARATSSSPSTVARLYALDRALSLLRAELTPVYTFGGPRRRPGAHPRAAEDMGPSSPLMAFLPILLLGAFVLFSLLPTLFGDNTPDPGYTFRPTTRHNVERHTLPHNVGYYVNQAEWEASKVWQSVPEQYRQRKDAAKFSSKLKNFEFSVEQTQIQYLQAECRAFDNARHRKIAEEAGVFGWGADYDKIRDLRAQTHPACEQLRKWGVSTQGY